MQWDDEITEITPADRARNEILSDIRDQLKVIKWAIFVIAWVSFGALMNWFGNLHPFWKGWQ